MRYLSLCCIIKDEDPFLHEWLTYHALLGVEHFYIYDNESKIPAHEHPAVRKYLQAGRATLHQVEGKEMQLKVYDDCIERYASENYWIGFIDLDEFICLTAKNSGVPLDFRPFLAEFEDYQGLALNWLEFTSSGYLGSPAGLVLSNYTKVRKKPTDFDFHVKSVVRPEKVLCSYNAHVFYSKDHSLMHNENHRPLPLIWPYSQPSHRRAWLNHYHFKSQEDYEFKIARGRADLVTLHNAEEKYTAFYAHADAETVENLHAASLAAQVREWMERQDLPPLLPEPESEELEAYLRLSLDFMNGGLRPDAAPEQRLSLAQAVLCKAATRHADKVQLWVMRARLARLARNHESAWRLIEKAISIEEHPYVYEELFHLTLAARGKREAANVLFYLENLPRSRVTDPDYVNKLELFKKMVQ